MTTAQFHTPPAETRVAVSGSFARALKALAGIVRRNRSATETITREWFAAGSASVPAVRYDEYHLDTLKPYACSAEE